MITVIDWKTPLELIKLLRWFKQKERENFCDEYWIEFYDYFEKFTTFMTLFILMFLTF